MARKCFYFLFFVVLGLFSAYNGDIIGGNQITMEERDDYHSVGYGNHRIETQRARDY
jgi:hypothetical protein